MNMILHTRARISLLGWRPSLHTIAHIKKTHSSLLSLDDPSLAPAFGQQTEHGVVLCALPGITEDLALRPSSIAMAKMEARHHPRHNPSLSNLKGLLNFHECIVGATLEKSSCFSCGPIFMSKSNHCNLISGSSS